MSSTTVAVSSLDPATRARMWGLFEQSYADVEPARFQADLDSKDDVFLLWDGPVLQGFSTVCRYTHDLPGGRATIVYSGDTVVDAEYRGQNALQWAFFRYIVATKLSRPNEVVAWFLISKGYKTYLLLSRNFTCFWPRPERATPAWASDLIDTLSAERFGEAYDPATGTLHFEHPMGRLKRGVAPPPSGRDPDIDFFVRCNPNHAEGDELCCIGLVNARLVLSYPFRALRRVLTYRPGTRG